MTIKKSLLDPQLAVFLAVAKYSSMHAAAKVVHLTQTAITQRIRSLEARLNATLFIRTNQGVYLTAEGEALLRYCNATLELEGEALAAIQYTGSKVPVRVCLTGPTSIMSSRAIPQCLQVLKKFPHLLMTFDVNDSEQSILSLQRGESHIAIIEPKYLLKGMKHKKLRPEKYALVCTQEWQDRSLQDIVQNERIIDFDESDSMTLNYLKKYSLLSSVQNERHYVNRMEPLVQMFIKGFGYGVLNTDFIKPYLANNSLMLLNANKTYSNELFLVWYERPEPPAYFFELTQAIK